jgi:hypothetical protein
MVSLPSNLFSASIGVVKSQGLRSQRRYQSTAAEVGDILRDPNKINALKWKDEDSNDRDLNTIFKANADATTTIVDARDTGHPKTIQPNPSNGEHISRDTADPTAVQPHLSNGEPLSQDIDQPILTIGERLPQHHPSHPNVTKNSRNIRL